MSAPLDQRVAQVIVPYKSRGGIDHDWEADRLYCDLVSGILNAANHLWWVGLEPDEEPT